MVPEVVIVPPVIAPDVATEVTVPEPVESAHSNVAVAPSELLLVFKILLAAGRVDGKTIL